MIPLIRHALESPALAIVAYIVDSLWEGILVAALAALVIRVFRRANATTRYAIWYIALLAVIALPGLTVAAMALEPHGSAHRAQIALPHAVTLFGAALWGLGALAGLLRIAAGYAALAKLQRDALPLPPGYREAMPLWEDSIGRGRETRLCVSSNVAVPVAVGLFDGMILMPDHLLQSFDRADVDRFSLHEMAHLQRRDDWTCALERIACAVLFFNPAVGWIARHLDLEREVACDDWVVAQTREVRPYAVGLTKMAEATKWPHRAAPTPAIFASRKSISIRIERLLNKHRDVRPTLAGGPALACAAAILAASAVLLPLAPVIGDVPAETVSAQRGAPAVRFTVSAKAAVRGAPRQAMRAAAKPAPHPHAVAVKIPPAKTAAVKKRIATVAVVVPRAHWVSPRTHLAAPRAQAVRRSHGHVVAPLSAAPASPDVITVPRSTKSALVAIQRELATARVETLPAVEAPPIRPLPAARLAPPAPLRLSHVVVAQTSAKTPDFLDALTTAGYQKLSADEIIALHDNGVSTSLITASARYFAQRLTVREIIILSTCGISASFLDDLARYGLRTGVKDVTAFSVNGVTPAYAARVLHAYPQLTGSSVIELMHYGVPSRFVVGLRERGYGPTVSEIAELAMHGVSLSYVDAVNARRGTKMPLPEIVKLHDHGVSADAN